MERQRANDIKVSVTEKNPLISSLPEHIIHEILSRLTMLDFVRTSCLSKEWKTLFLSFPWVNIDKQDFNDVPFDEFKDTMYHHVMSIKGECLVMYKFRIRMHYKYLKKGTEVIEECTTLVLQTSTVKEFDFQIMPDYCSPTSHKWSKLFHHIYNNAKTLVMLRLSGLAMIQPSNRDIKFSHLEILRLENVMVERESVIDGLFTSCPLIREISLVKCYGLVHLKVCGNLGHLKLLEIAFCELLESVEIQVPGLEKLFLSEIERRRGDYDSFMVLRIDSETSETLRELTLCNSSMAGTTFTGMFSRCSNVESLVLDRCNRFFRVKIASQKLRKLVFKKCYDLLLTDIDAPNLTSFIFCNYVPYGFYDDHSINDKIQYCEEISQQQECMLDFSLLMSKNIWISLWFNKFNDSEGQKMVIYPTKNPKGYAVVVLEDWSSMAELALMTQISESAGRTTITTMNFLDLANYVFGDSGKNLKRVLAISSSGQSRLHEVLKSKPKVSCTQCSSVVITRVEVEAFSTCWPSFSRVAPTLKATSFSVSFT